MTKQSFEEWAKEYVEEQLVHALFKGRYVPLSKALVTFAKLTKHYKDTVLEKMNELYNNQQKHTSYKKPWEELYRWLEE
jgi:hypothetical protein